MHNLAYKSMEKFVGEYYHGGSVLEIGGSVVNGSVRGLFRGPYTTMDVSGNVDIIVNDPYKWDEIADSSYQYVISTSVLEHIEFPWLTMLECHRVLRIGGICCHVAPSAGFEHKFPLDCYRYYADGGRALLKWAGFKILKVYTNKGNEYEDIDGGNLWKDTVMIGMKV